MNFCKSSLVASLCVCAFAAFGCAEESSGKEIVAMPTTTSLKYPEGSTGTTVFDVPGVGPQKADYVVRNGHAFIWGDIGLSVDDLVDASDVRATNAGRRYEQYRWPGGVIPYEIDSAIPDPHQTRTDIANGLALWQAPNTLLTFVAHTPGSGGDFVKFNYDPNLDSTGGGWSDWIGRKGGGQQQNIYVALMVPPGQGVVAHEMGHAIGLYHEQQRADRRDFILVYDGTDGLADRFTPCGANKSAYLRYFDVPAGQQPFWGPDGVDLGPFDFQSRMLYAPGGCCNGQDCMTKRDGTTWTPNGTTLSAVDKAAVGRLYLDFGTNFQFIGTGLGSAAVTAWAGSNRYDVFAVRNSDGHTLHGVFDGTSWSGLVDDWGGVCSGIQAASWGTNRIDLVTIGTDGNVYHFWWENGTPFWWENMGGGPASVATISSQGFGKVDIFMVKTSDHNIYRREFNGGWGNWQQITTGGGFAGWTSSLDAASWGNQRIDVISATTAGKVWQVWTYDNGANWFSNELQGSVPAKSFVSATSWGYGRLDVFFDYASTTIKRLSFEGAWGPLQNARVSQFTPLRPDAVSRAVNNGGMSDVDGVMNMIFAESGSWYVATTKR